MSHRARFANPLFVALDTPDLSHALAIAERVQPVAGGLKVGLEFISAQGPEGIRAVAALGMPIFADVKFHDIPNTVAGAARALVSLNIALFNVHVAGGEAMMRAAVDAAAKSKLRPAVLGVTILTSLDDAALVSIGQLGPAQEQTLRLARLAKRAGLDGVVCSPQDAGAVRDVCGTEFLIVTPGIRPSGVGLADQRRVTTPAAAVQAGADILVVGRPVTEAPDPAAAAKAILSELAVA
jgi:orotidine-5'-phosphate decarboxylase